MEQWVYRVDREAFAVDRTKFGDDLAAWELERIEVWLQGEPDGQARLADLEVVNTALEDGFSGGYGEACMALCRVRSALVGSVFEGTLGVVLEAVYEAWMLAYGALCACEVKAWR